MMIRETKKRMLATGHRIEDGLGFWHTQVAVDDGLTGNSWGRTTNNAAWAQDQLHSFFCIGEGWLNVVKTCTREQVLEAKRVHKS